MTRRRQDPAERPGGLEALAKQLEGLHPLVALGVGAALVVGLDAGRVNTATPEYGWLLIEGAVAAVALLIAWRGQERLRLPGLLLVALAFQAALVALDLAAGAPADHGTDLYAQQGQALLDGNYPHSEYPTGAVLLFAVEAGLGGGSTRTANAVVMIPFQLLAVAAIWACRTRWSAWLAALVAFWPFARNFWELTFDLVPAALLAWGLVLALRERFVLAGALLGLGAAVKWTPALSLAALLVWLVASGRPRDAARQALAAICVFAVLTVPFLAWSPHEVLAAYRMQAGRTIIAESLPYLPLHWLGRATVWEDLTHAAHVPSWANGAATAVQLILVLATLALAALVRGRRASGVAVAALVPVVFLVTNRIFSAQFLLVLLPAWAIAIALLARSRREQLALGAAAACASLANAFVFPYGLPEPLSWQTCSTLLFALAIGLTAWLLVRAYRRPGLVSPCSGSGAVGSRPVMRRTA